MAKVNKMFLVSPREMDRLTRTESSSIRQTAEDDLDDKMRAVLNEQGLSSYEKVKRYEALLHRYLTLMRQGLKDERRVTLQLQPDISGSSGPESSGPDDDDVTSELIKNLPSRDRKNAGYIMQKLSEAGVEWTSRGEFVDKGNVVKGSHIMDLFKNLSYTYKKKAQSPPKGWTSFLKTLAGVNIPLSLLNNRHAREEYLNLQTGTEREQKVLPRKNLREKKIVLSPKWSTPEPRKNLRKKRILLSPKWITPEPRKKRILLSPKWSKWD